MIDGAQSTLQREREDHRRWQEMMTDALAQAEAQTRDDEALMRDALRCLRAGSHDGDTPAVIRALARRLAMTPCGETAG